MRSPSGARGSYLLIIGLPTAVSMEVGSLGQNTFVAGQYLYAGSAMGGLKARLRRHLNRNKTPRWHIDYLTNAASVHTVVVFESEERLECRIAEELRQQFDSVPDFGCSDCDCTSHLFFTPLGRELRTDLERVLVSVKANSAVLGRKNIRAYLGLSRN